MSSPVKNPQGHGVQPRLGITKREMVMRDLDQANCGIIGISKVLNAILTEEGFVDGNSSLYNNDFIKGCLVDGLERLAFLSAERLECLAQLIGKPDGIEFRKTN